MFVELIFANGHERSEALVLVIGFNQKLLVECTDVVERRTTLDFVGSFCISYLLKSCLYKVGRNHVPGMGETGFS